MRLAVFPNLIKLSYPNSNLYDRHVRLGSEFLIYAKDNLFSCFIVILRKGAVELDFGHNFLETVQMLIKNHWQTILWEVATCEQQLDFSNSYAYNSYGVAQRLLTERWSDHLVAPLGPQERAFPADTEFTR